MAESAWMTCIRHISGSSGILDCRYGASGLAQGVYIIWGCLNGIGGQLPLATVIDEETGGGVMDGCYKY